MDVTTAPPSAGLVPSALTAVPVACGASGEVVALRASAAALAAAVAGATGWSGPDRQGVLVELNLAIDTLTAIRSSLLIVERDAGTWRGHGDPNFAAWVGRKSRLGKRGGASQVRAATQLDTVPKIRDAVAAGELPLEHAAIIAKVAATGTPAQREAATSPAGQKALLEMAAGQDAATFALSTDRYAANADPDALNRDHDAQYRARYLSLTQTSTGTTLKGFLDTFAGNRLRLALEAATPRPAADDTREYGQRNADALDAIATRILASADTKPGAHVPPQVSVILTEETWIAAQAHRDHRRHALTTFGFPTDTDDDGNGVDAGRVPALGNENGIGSRTGDLGCGGGPVMLPTIGYAPATLEDGTPVPSDELGVVMCDCELTRIVINADGVPLDLGRTERLFTGPQRKAVIARDRECAWPDCHAHARWCHIHHLKWWQRDGGVTSVENGALLCNFHHHEVHRLDLTLTRHTITPGRGPGSTGIASIARVRYEFTDPAGRKLRQPPQPASAGAGASPPNGPPEPARPPAPPSDLAKPGELNLAHPGELDLADPGELDLTQPNELNARVA